MGACITSPSLAVCFLLLDARFQLDQSLHSTAELVSDTWFDANLEPNLMATSCNSRDVYPPD